ncbi:MAG: ribonuclease PH [Synechococcaceae cyanobacterium SM2_3_1]|nr:ribonuclease PH [Synechococcaceae cyanobacterium SM2_3_1]
MVWQRPDGRPPEALRPISFQRAYTKVAPGSVLTRFGETTVLCTASVTEEVPRFLQGTGQGWLTAEYRMLPSSTRPRQQRETLKLSGRTAEIQRLIGRSLRCSLDLKQLGPRTITVDADVLQADGGTRTAAITGGYLALVDAVSWLKTEMGLEHPLLLKQVAAVSVGMVHAQAVTDLCYEEDVQASVDLNVVMTESGTYVEIQGTAEQDPFSPIQLSQMLTLADQSIQQLLRLQTQALLSD